MNFRTIVSVEQRWHISHDGRVLSLGSCFADSIGKRLCSLKYDVDVNPFGTLYNPLSISTALNYILINKKFEECDLFHYNGLWNSYSHHGSFSSPDKNECLEKINSRLGNVDLSKIDFIFITLGTSWVYLLKDSRQVVANCHKQSAEIFERRRLSVDEITSCLFDVLNRIWLTNPNMRVVFTVSPIRHWKDGAHENALSKSTLLLAVDELQKKSGNVEYFPAYEILMDDLRDYRFYEEDMVHPSLMALNYIFERFCESYFSLEEQQLNKEIEKVSRDLHHRPLHTPDQIYAQFCQSTLKKIDVLKKKNNTLDYTEEIVLLKNRINNI